MTPNNEDKTHDERQSLPSANSGSQGAGMPSAGEQLKCQCPDRRIHGEEGCPNLAVVNGRCQTCRNDHLDAPIV